MSKEKEGIEMKKVTGYIDVRALGRYEFDFYVEDDVKDEEINQRVREMCDYYIGYNVDPGYVQETRTETIYRKKEEWE